MSALIVFAHVVLARVGVRFALGYPQVELEIVAEDRMADPVQDGYDLVIHVNPDRDELLVGRRIATDRRVLVAAPSHAASFDETAASLPAMVLTRASGETWRIDTEQGETRVIEPKPVLRLSSLLMAREAVLGDAAEACCRICWSSQTLRQAGSSSSARKRTRRSRSGRSTVRAAC